MEEFAVLLITAVAGIAALRLLTLPIKWGVKLLIHCAAGLICLWILNSVSMFTGILFPINAVTVLTAGVLGLPGIAVLALLAVI